MAVSNQEIAERFKTVAEILAVQGANPFRIRAYQRAALVLENLSQDVTTLIQSGQDLTELPGIGKDLAAKINELSRTGHLRFLENLQRKTPEGILQLLKIPSLGPKRVQKLLQLLQVKNLQDLKKAVQDKKIRTVAGFGKKLEEQIAQELTLQQDNPKRFLWTTAQQLISPLFEQLQKISAVDKIVLAGSFRRHKETVGDIDILATSRSPELVLNQFVQHADVAHIVAKGDTRSTVILRHGLQVDLRVIAPESYGAALLYLTGSKAHNIALRKLAQARGWKINEYGVFDGAKRLAGKSEEEIYKILGLQFIPPELREDQGEISAAQNGHLPQLITLKDLKGDLHAHTVDSDGQASLAAMAKAASAFGLTYLAITDHSKYLGITNGLDAKRLSKQIQMIDHHNARSKDITLLKGIEVDILEDGSLALANDILQDLDVVVGAIHTKFHLTREKQTERILRALDNPYLTILAHPTGRLLNERRPYEVDLEKIMRATKTRGKFLEVNSQMQRLDLDDQGCRMAKELGVTLVISSDAHSSESYDLLTLGVSQAARGWIASCDVLNTRSLTEVRRRLAAAQRH